MSHTITITAFCGDKGINFFIHLFFVISDNCFALFYKCKLNWTTIKKRRKVLGSSIKYDLHLSVLMVPRRSWKCLNHLAHFPFSVCIGFSWKHHQILTSILALAVYFAHHHHYHFDSFSEKSNPSAFFGVNMTVFPGFLSILLIVNAASGFLITYLLDHRCDIILLFFFQMCCSCICQFTGTFAACMIIRSSLFCLLPRSSNGFRDLFVIVPTDDEVDGSWETECASGTFSSWFLMQ